ncbi:ABC transporter permease [Frankia sp. Cr1]|uniref:ABC transporter permease n=1 Tax=Frankia sp. Cr1 TaxID=3073931 RepID=UPI002AD2C206|nr:ABC transporter permease [Frankia sp. Cr1]
MTSPMDPAYPGRRTHDHPAAQSRRSRWRLRAPAASASVVADSLVVAWRNLKRIPRIPELAIVAILQSVMFVLLFSYVFGGAIPLPGGGSYREYVMAGIIAETLTFAAATTAIGITDDLAKGLIDRFRSLPMARSAFLTGRTVSDVVYNAVILAVLMLSGLVVGWRVRNGPIRFLAAVALGLLFAYAMAWIGVWLGLLVPTVEVAQQVAFTAIFPITFLSNAFVPIQTLPGFLQPVAEWNPVSSLTAAMRVLFGNPNPFGSSGFPTKHPVLATLIWVTVLVTIFASLSIRRYQAMSR